MKSNFSYETVFWQLINVQFFMDVGILFVLFKKMDEENWVSDSIF